MVVVGLRVVLVVVDVFAVVVGGGALVEVLLVVTGSLLTVPKTQYCFEGSRLGQEIPGFKRTNSAVVRAQLFAKVSQVSPLDGLNRKAQSTPRFGRASCAITAPESRPAAARK